ncbi:MAG: transposase [Hyphomicrobiales bacterium]|nr:MAG: transposase [Hyphomicrobiales bacterium]
MRYEQGFQAISGANVKPGMVLRQSGVEEYLRITHVFEHWVYGMWVSTAEKARDARRPFPMRMEEYRSLEQRQGSELGVLTLPEIFYRPLRDDEKIQLDKTQELIAPLVREFKDLENLSRSNFTALIRRQAESSSTPFETVLRCVKRYYYFGMEKRALLELPRGPAPGENTYKDVKNPRRRGRPASVEQVFGPNEFVVSDEDIADMLEAMKAALKKGPSYKIEAYEEEYLPHWFATRHPHIYEQYLSEKIPPPVSVKQFEDYIGKGLLSISKDLLKNLKGVTRNRGYAASHYSFGPGSVYEIDATGGRIHLVVGDGDGRLLGPPPTIYIVIDRWSRYVVGAYVTTRSPSLQEVCEAVLVAITPRDRFQNMGVDITDARWPAGRTPASLCSDRGSDFMAKGFSEAVVDRLGIEHTVLRPLSPDGKAIVERVIRTLKRHLSKSAVNRGGYTERPNTSPQASNAAKLAKTVAVNSLKDVYRALVEVIEKYNKRQHTALKRKNELTRNGIPPTPHAAFVWGMKNISGLELTAVGEREAQILLMRDGVARGEGGFLRFRERNYAPTDEAAQKATVRWRNNNVGGIAVKVDSFLSEIWMWSGRTWCRFALTPGGTSDLGGATLDEDELLAPLAAHTGREVDARTRMQRLRTKTTQPAPARSRPVKVPRAEQEALRQEASDAIKSVLNGKQPRPASKTNTNPARTERQRRADELERAELASQMRILSKGD